MGGCPHFPVPVAPLARDDRRAHADGYLTETLDQRVNWASSFSIYMLGYKK